MSDITFVVVIQVYTQTYFDCARR